MAYPRAADLLVCVRDRYLLRVRRLQFQTRSAENRRRNWMVPCPENCWSDLDCVRLAGFHPLACALSHGIYPRTAWHRDWTCGVRSLVEFGHALEPGGPGFRPYACTPLDDGITGDRGKIEEHEKTGSRPGVRLESAHWTGRGNSKRWAGVICGHRAFEDGSPINVPTGENSVCITGNAENKRAAMHTSHADAIIGIKTVVCLRRGEPWDRCRS